MMVEKPTSEKHCLPSEKPTISLVQNKYKKIRTVDIAIIPTVLLVC